MTRELYLKLRQETEQRHFRERAALDLVWEMANPGIPLPGTEEQKEVKAIREGLRAAASRTVVVYAAAPGKKGELGVACPRCGSAVWRKGRTRAGKLRFICHQR